MTNSRVKAPATVACGNPDCSRDNLNFEQYRTRFFSPEVPPEDVHTVRAHNPRVAGWNVICTCGHYTLFRAPDDVALTA